MKYIKGMPYKLIDMLSMLHVIVQVVGWEMPNPTTKESSTTWKSYTQCHLDVGPALQGWIGYSSEVVLVTLGGMRWIWIEMEVEPLEINSKWSKIWEEIPCKSSDCFPKGKVLLWMIVPTRDRRKSNLQWYMLVWINKLSLLSLICSSIW